MKAVIMKILKKEISIIFLLSLVCSFFFFYKLGSYKLIDVDEPRYAEAAREMIQSSNWITPYFNYDLRFDKPIFFYWLIALSYLIFGISEFAARFPSAILATGLVFFTYYFGRTTISRSFGLISSLILASSLEFIAISRMSITDMALAFFICAAIYSGFIAAFREDVFKKYWWWLVYLFSGIAVLTKGPVGLALPGLILFIYLILIGKLKESLKPKFIIPGFLIFFASVIPWYYAIIKEYGMVFINYFFLKHNFERFASSGFQHQQPFYFYFIVIFAGFFPWIIYFISSLIKYTQKLYKFALNKKKTIKKFDFAIFKEADNKIKVILFSFIWFFVIFLFFSSSRAKLLTYILPLFPAMTLLTANLWNDFIYENKNIKSIKISAKILTAICFILSLVMIFGFNFLLPRDEKLQSGYVDISFLIHIIFIFIFIPASIIFYIYKNKKIYAFFAKILLMIEILLITTNMVLPVVYNSGQRDLINYISLSKGIFSKYNARLVTYNLIKPSIVFYSREKIYNIESYVELCKCIADKKPVLIITKKSYLDEYSPKIKFYVISRGKKYSLISNFRL